MRTRKYTPYRVNTYRRQARRKRLVRVATFLALLAIAYPVISRLDALAFEKNKDSQKKIAKLEENTASQADARFLLKEPRLETSNLEFNSAGVLALGEIPEEWFLGEDGRLFSRADGDLTLFYTLDPKLQHHAEKVMKKYRIPWGAIVAIDPRTGKVLTLASHSQKDGIVGSVATRATFPAASLFKMITAAAAVETSGFDGSNEVRYRGGNYTLNRWNYKPDSRRDRRKMTLEIALGKSCNPVFARVALQNLSRDILERYALSFGFNRNFPFEYQVEPSKFVLDDDRYEIARTAAGFGDVYISPLHAAVMTAAFANGGTLVQPYIIDQVRDSSGGIRYRGEARTISRAVLQSTADEVLEMMLSTIESGTARKTFARLRRSKFREIPIAAKTGTLSGKNPKGIYHWFVAAAPADAPEIVLAALVIDGGGARINGSRLGRYFLEEYFRS